MTGSEPSSPSCHSTLSALPPPPFLGKAPPFVLATKIRKKWDICKANEARMAGSCTPSKAEANCVLSTQSKWMGERQRETFEVNDGMGYLLRKSGGHWAHVQLLMRVVTVAVWSLERNNRFQYECLENCKIQTRDEKKVSNLVKMLSLLTFFNISYRNNFISQENWCNYSPLFQNLIWSEIPYTGKPQN